MFISYCSSVLCSSDLGRDQGQGAQLAIAVAGGNARHQFGVRPLGLAAVAVGIDVPEIVRRPLAVPVGADLGGGLDHPVEHDGTGECGGGHQKHFHCRPSLSPQVTLAMAVRSRKALPSRSEERRAGNERVSAVRSRWSPYHKQQKKTKTS